MKIKHNDVSIPHDNPFANCRLDRAQYANTLTNIVKNYAEGFVLAINSEWGTGKTTFVKMWKQDLDNEQFRTLYFNAWENDFEINPLIAFLAELKKLVKRDSDTFKNLLSKGAVIAKNIAPVLVKAVVDRYIDAEVVKEGLIEASKGLVDVLEDEIKEYSKKKNGIKEFRESLEKFVKELNSDKPLVFIIDELDRCRPNYSVELLEQIKHFFSVPGIVFVLSIDKEQLGHAVRGVYGSEGLDATEYLRRFIDLEYTIPQPEVEAFVKYLYDYFGFNFFFSSSDRVRYQEFQYDKEDFISFATILFENSKVTLRQQEKMFAQTKLVIDTFRPGQYMYPSLLITLIYFKNFIPDFYNKIRSRQFSIHEILERMQNHLPKPLNEKQVEYYVHLEATFAFFYNSYIATRQEFQLLTVDDSIRKANPTISVVFDKTEGHQYFVRVIRNLQSKFNFGSLTLENWFKKIELIQPAQF